MALPSAAASPPARQVDLNQNTAPASSKPKIAKVAATVAVISMLTITRAAIAVAVTQKVTLAGAFAVIAKALGLAAIGTAGSIAILYGVPLLILLGAALAICCRSKREDATTAPPQPTPTAESLQEDAAKEALLQQIRTELQRRRPSSKAQGWDRKFFYELEDLKIEQQITEYRQKLSAKELQAILDSLRNQPTTKGCDNSPQSNNLGLKQTYLDDIYALIKRDGTILEEQQFEFIMSQLRQKPLYELASLQMDLSQKTITLESLHRMLHRGALNPLDRELLSSDDTVYRALPAKQPQIPLTDKRTQPTQEQMVALDAALSPTLSQNEINPIKAYLLKWRYEDEVTLLLLQIENGNITPHALSAALTDTTWQEQQTLADNPASHPRAWLYRNLRSTLPAGGGVTEAEADAILETLRHTSDDDLHSFFCRFARGAVSTTELRKMLPTLSAI